MRGLEKQQTEIGGSQLARANSGFYFIPPFWKVWGKGMNQADKNRSHSPSGYRVKLNPESKAAESLCYPLKIIW